MVGQEYTYDYGCSYVFIIRDAGTRSVVRLDQCRHELAYHDRKGVKTMIKNKLHRQEGKRQ